MYDEDENGETQGTQKKPLFEHLEAIGEINLRMESGTWSGNVKFVIMKNLAEDVILGQNYLQTFGRSISFIEHQVDMRCGGIIKLKTERIPVHIQRADARLDQSCVIPAGHVRLVKVVCPWHISPRRFLTKMVSLSLLSTHKLRMSD